MKYQSKLTPGKILKRYKRFLADVRLESGEVITAHTPNTGSMKTCWEPEWDVLLSYHDNPNRKLKYGLEMTNNGKTWINVNTSLTNKIALEALQDKKIPELAHYQYFKPEVKIGQSRIDILAFNAPEDNHQLATEKCYIEVKNVTLLGDNMTALFPDAVSTRGQKHLKELIQIKESGHESAMLYVINREDTNSFSPAVEIDPEYADLLKKAEQSGVKILPYKCKLSESEVKIDQLLPYKLI